MKAILLESIDSKAREFKTYGRFPEALRSRLTLEKAYDRYETPPSKKATNLNWIAYLAMQLDLLPTAERAARKCLAIYRPIAKDNDEKLATYYSMLAAVLAESLMFEEAIRVDEQAVAIFESHHGGDSEFVKQRKKDLQDMRSGEVRCYLERR